MQAFSGAIPDFFLDTRATQLLFLLVKVVLLLAVVAVVIRRVVPGLRQIVRSPTGSLVFWMILPPVGAWAFSEISGHSVFEATFLLPTVPAALIFIGSAIASLKIRLLSVALAVAATAASFAIVLPTYGQSTENWSGAARTLSDSSAPGDCVVANPMVGIERLAYYVEMDHLSSLPRPVLPEQSWTDALSGRFPPSDEDYSDKQLSQAKVACRRIWFENSSKFEDSMLPAEIDRVLGGSVVEVRTLYLRGVTLTLFAPRPQTSSHPITRSS